jgi:hypothetical protein
MCTSRSRPTSPSKSKSSRTRNSSPNKDNGSVRSGQDGFKLACFGVSDGGRGTELPPSLLEFVNTTIKQDVQETPRARRIAGKALAVARMSETNGARLLRAHLLDTPAIETDDPDDGVPGIAVSSNSDLYEQWLPEPLDEMVKQWFLKLEAPRPDETMGYLRETIARSCKPKLQCFLTEEEERLFRNFDVTKDVTFPFLTCQWKSQLTNGTELRARQQAARDGAVVVNSMYQFISRAYPNELPPPEHTAHISITSDMTSASAWVH